MDIMSCWNHSVGKAIPASTNSWEHDMTKKLMATDEKSDLLRTVGKRIKSARQFSGLKQTDLMKILYTRTTNTNRISEIENGKYQLSLIQFFLLCKKLSVSSDYLLGFSIEPELDLTTGRASLIYQNANEAVRVGVSALCKTIAKSMAPIYKNEAHAVTYQVKKLYSTYLDASKNINFEKSCPELHKEIIKLMLVVRELEKRQAQHMRCLENAVDDTVDYEDEQQLSLANLWQDIVDEEFA